MNRDDVIDVLTAVAAADRRTVGEADVQIWLGVLEHIPLDVALEAVRDHLRDKPDMWMQPGHVYQRSREIMRNKSLNAVAKDVLPQPKAVEGSKQYSDERHRRRVIAEFARKVKSPEPLRDGEAESA
ncbi:hypothetical protein AB4Z39_10670 [Mycobacterium adipatum]|uniref:hypothetical protein n=1 Tax=Mycobacterium adipatum TaxID=1682113 RepID=UPI0034E0627E